jgi:hypothetical protein
MSLLTDKINIWMDEVKKDLIEKYDIQGFRASGKYEKELQSVVTETKSILYGAKHSYWMENGRNPNKDQSKEAINHFVRWFGHYRMKQWLEYKGITGNPYTLARKIATKGYSVSKRPTVISGVLNEDRIKKLTDMITVYFVGEIKSNVLKNLKK